MQTQAAPAAGAYPSMQTQAAAGGAMQRPQAPPPAPLTTPASNPMRSMPFQEAGAFARKVNASMSWTTLGGGLYVAPSALTEGLVLGLRVRVCGSLGIDRGFRVRVKGSGMWLPRR